jgi:hypothetical protein
MQMRSLYEIKRWISEFDAIHPVVYTELHKEHYVLFLAETLFVIIFSNAACFDPVVIIWCLFIKNLTLKVKM